MTHRRTTKSNIHHFTFSPKYRRAIFDNPFIKAECERLIFRICSLKKWDIVALNIQPDHIHLLLETTRNRKHGTQDVAAVIKWYTSKWLRHKFPHLRTTLHPRFFWQHKYWSRTVGADSPSVRRYIQNQ